MFRLARVPTASLLCCFEKEGYGRLAFESVLDEALSSLTIPGIEDLRLGSVGDSDVRDDDLSFVVALRCEDGL